MPKKTKIEPYRSIRIDGIGKELILSKVTSVKTDQEMIHLDKLKDGTWRLIC